MRIYEILAAGSDSWHLLALEHDVSWPPAEGKAWIAMAYQWGVKGFSDVWAARVLFSAWEVAQPQTLE